MATTEVSVSPPANYPSDDWLPEGDYFHVSPPLRPMYAKAEPNEHQIRRLFENIPLPGGGRVTVDKLVTDASGRYVKADPIELDQHAARGLLSRYRPAMTEVDPFATTSLAYQTWLHDLRLASATKTAEVEATLERHYQMDLIRVCTNCGTANPQPSGLLGPGLSSWSSFLGRPFCDRCLPAVQLAATLRHYQRYQQEIDQWLDEHLPEWQPRPPQPPDQRW